MTLFLLFNISLRKKLIKKVSKALVSHQINTHNRSMNGLAEAVQKQTNFTSERIAVLKCKIRIYRSW